MKHEIARNKEIWGSKGRFHDQPTTYRYIKDLSDSHLLHIIAWVAKEEHNYDESILDLMINEQNFRMENYISVPDYDHPNYVGEEVNLEEKFQEKSKEEADKAVTQLINRIFGEGYMS